MKKKYIVQIYAEFGSDFQHRAATKSLKVFLDAWETFYSARHKKNKIEIEWISPSPQKEK
jgi:hypothetical protein